ncbi:MAG: hypothetical protein DMH00_03685 [Acidobacteria bacterium]|nr:MAG: hypothetical protein DMH00_03685 [Acidobacteriota bacterium]
MNSFSNRRSTPLVLCVALSFLPGFASDAPNNDSPVPARVRTLEGEATLHREREQDRVAVTVNTPVFPGDGVEVEAAGHLELQLPDGTLVWLDEGTRVDIVAMQGSPDDSREETVLKLWAGQVETEIQAERGEKSEMRLDTPESSVYLMSRGRFRIESNSGSTTVTSYRGVAELAGDDGSMLVRSGQQSRVEANSAPEEPWSVNTLRQDAFGEWCEERTESYVIDRDPEEQEYIEEVPSPVRHYTSELDYYGNWQYVTAFGWVWRPTTIQVGWRPYYSGYWSWCPRGWSWVSYEPWGWLPYHYGRWSWVSTVGWVWIPGGVYSGAWVSWAVTPTYVGWCPLDFFNRPAYVSFNYTNLNVNQYGGGWNFLPLNRWGERNVSRDIVRADRVPELHGAITTRVLPHFDPEQARVRPGVVQRVVQQTSPRPEVPERNPGAGGVSFRQADRREWVFKPRSAPFHPRPGDLRRQRGETSGPLNESPRVSIPGAERANPSRPDYRSNEPMRRLRLGTPRQAPRQEGEPRDPPRRGNSSSPLPRSPSVSEDPSRKVLNRIFREGNSAVAPRNDSPRGEGRGKSERLRVEGNSRQPPVTPRADARTLHPAPIRRDAPTPPRSQDGKKKDKP